MTREKLIEKLRNGERITPEDVAAVAAAEQLEQLQSEADQRNNVANIEAMRAAKRENAVGRLLEADSEAERAARDYEAALLELDRAGYKIGKRLIEARSRIIRAQRDFNGALCEIIAGVQKLGRDTHYAPEIEANLRELLSELRSRAAALKAIRCNDWRGGLMSFRYAFADEHAYELPKTNFGSLADSIERIAATVPEPPPEKADKPDDLELWAFAQAEAFNAGIEPNYGDIETPKKAA